jgi:hypothetical protein
VSVKGSSNVEQQRRRHPLRWDPKVHLSQVLTSRIQIEIVAYSGLIPYIALNVEISRDSVDISAKWRRDDLVGYQIDFARGGWITLAN